MTSDMWQVTSGEWRQKPSSLIVFAAETDSKLAGIDSNQPTMKKNVEGSLRSGSPRKRLPGSRAMGCRPCPRKSSNIYCGCTSPPPKIKPGQEFTGYSLILREGKSLFPLL